MNPFRKLAGQTAIYGIPSILGRFLNYLLVPLYTYGLLTQQEYGIVNLFYSYTALLMVMLTYGMETAFFRFSETEKEREKVYSTALISLLATTFVFLLFTALFPQQVANLIDYPQYPRYVTWFAWIMALDTLAAIPFARLRALNRPVRFALIRSVNIFSNIFFNLFFLLFCPWLDRLWQGSMAVDLLRLIYRPDWTIEYIFLANLLSSLLTIGMLLPQVLRLKWEFDRRLWWRMVRYSLPLMVAGMAGIVNETVDRILLRYLLPLSAGDAEAAVGVYSACYKIAILMVLFIQAYRFAAEPFFFSRMKQDDAKQVYARVMDYFIITVSFIYLVTMLFLDTIFIRFTGPAFRAARDVIPVLMLAKLFLGVYYNLSIWYKITGKTLWGALITLTGAAITIFLNVIWIPASPDRYLSGYTGSAWATLACYTVMMIMAWAIGQRYYPVPYRLGKFLGYTGLSVLLFLISSIIPPLSRFVLILLNAGLLGLFVAVVWFVERPLQALRR